MCDVKKLAYAIPKQDSRIASEIGRGLGWDWLRDQGKQNQANPGRAVTHAAEIYTASILAPELYGAMGGGAAGGAGTAADIAAEGATASPYLDAIGVQAGAPVSDLSTAAAKPGWLDSMVSGSGKGKGAGLLATQMAGKMLSPSQPPPQPQGAPMGGGQSGPLNNPYQQNPYGTAQGNSMGLLTNNMSEAEKKRLRAMGYQV